MVHPAESRAGKGLEVSKPWVFAQSCIHCLLQQAHLVTDYAPGTDMGQTDKAK